MLNEKIEWEKKVASATLNVAWRPVPSETLY